LNTHHSIIKINQGPEFEIRLLKIENADRPTDQLRLTCIPQKLADIKPYYALSYVWGNDLAPYRSSDENRVKAKNKGKVNHHEILLHGYSYKIGKT
jgi:hypothetical protein